MPPKRTPVKTSTTGAGARREASTGSNPEAAATATQPSEIMLLIQMMQQNLTKSEERALQAEERHRQEKLDAEERI